MTCGPNWKPPLLPLPLSDKELVTLWHSAATADEIASEHQVSRRAVLREWARLRNSGVLPRLDRYAMHRHENHNDGRPRVDEFNYHDELLEALIREHGDEGRPDLFTNKK
jgi:hypothetical protein